MYNFGPFGPEQDEEGMFLDNQQTPAAPTVPAPMAAAPKPMDPMVQDYLSKKFDLGNYTQGNRDKLVKDNEVGFGDKGLAALSAIGAGFMGRDPSAAGGSSLERAKNAAKGKLEEFDRGRKAKIDDYSLSQQMTKDDHENAKFDPTSEASVSFRNMINAKFPEVAKAYGDKWGQVSAADMDTIFKPLQLKEQSDARKQAAALMAGARSDARQDRLDAKALKQKELSTTQAKQRGLYESGALAEDQYNQAVGDGKDYDPTSVGQVIDNSSWAPNWMKNDHAVAAQSAQDAWIESYLRDASGAAIPDSERGAYKKQFFPQSGDSKTVAANKAALRNRKMENAAVGAGIETGHGPMMHARSSSAPDSGDMVQMLAPNGRPKMVARKDVEAAIAAGGQLVDGPKVGGR